MNAAHISRLTFRISRGLSPVSYLLCFAFAVGAAGSTSAQLPDLGFGSVVSVINGEEIDQPRAGTPDEEAFTKGLLGLVAGEYDTIRVALSNLGASEASHAVVRFYEEGPPEEERHPIGTDATLERIAPGETVTIQKVWDTLGRAGLNRISIQIDPDGLIEESDEENNSLSFRRTVHLLGDFNRDGQIDPLDRAILEQALGSRPGDAHWNPLCDIWRSDQPVPDPPNIRPQPDAMADHADHVVFDALMDLNLKSALARITFGHSDHVVFDPGEFHVGDEIRIRISFPTVGAPEVGQFGVRFFDGPPDEGGSPIGEALVSSAFGGIGKADILWHTEGISTGVHRIFAVADPDQRKVESSEANNVLSAPILLRGTDVTDPDLPLPERFCLMQNVPNPFNAGTAIPFEGAELEDGEVQITIYDNLGRTVYVQTVGAIHRAHGYVVWNGRDRSGRAVSSGVYFYRLTINGEPIGAPRSMVVLR